MKKTLLALSIATTLAACGGSSDNNEQIGIKVNQSTVPEFFVMEIQGEGEDAVEVKVAAPDVLVAEANKQLDPTGRYIIEDASSGESLFISDTFVGTYGTLAITSSGDWSYTLHRGDEDSETPEHPDLTALVKAGMDDLTETFTVTTADGTEKQFKVTIKGIDEDSAFSGTDFGLSLDNPALTGKVTSVTDANPAEAEFSMLYLFRGEEGKEVAIDLEDVASQLEVLQAQADAEAEKEEPADIDVEVVFETLYGKLKITAVTKPVAKVEAVAEVVADPENGIEAVAAVKGVAAAPAKVTWTYELNKSLEAVKGFYAYPDNLLQDTEGNPLPSLYYTDGLDAPSVQDGFTLVSKGLEGNETNVTFTISGDQLVDATFEEVPGSKWGTGEDDIYPLATVNINDAVTAGKLVVVDTNVGISADPELSEDTVIAQAETSEGLSYGSFKVDADGTWKYTVNTDLSAVRDLKYNAGAAIPTSLVDTVTVTSKDGSATTTFDITVLPVEQVAAEFTNVPALEDKDGVLISSSQVTSKITKAIGQLGTTDVNKWEEGFAFPQNVTVDYGTFSIDQDGNWTYDLDPDAIAGLALPHDVNVTVTAKDGTPVTFPITINEVQNNNLGAKIGSNDGNDAKWVINLPSIDNGDETTSDILKGKAEFSLRYPAESTKDVKVLFHGKTWKGTELHRTMLTMVLRANGEIKLYDAASGTSTFLLDQTHTKGEVTKFELSWDATEATRTANGGKLPPTLWFKINGEPVSGTPTGSAVGGPIVDGSFPAFTQASLHTLGPKFFGIQTKGTDTLDIDDFKVYSDIAGANEVLVQSFTGDDLLEGSPITVDYQYASKTTANSAASAVKFPAAPNFAARIADNDGNDAKWVINLPTIDNGDGTTTDLLTGAIAFKAKFPTDSTKDAKLVFHGKTWKGTELNRTMLAMVLRENGEIKLYDAASGSSTFVVDQTHTKGEFSNFLLTWDATADILAANSNRPNLTLSIDGKPVSGTATAAAKGGPIVDGAFSAFTAASLFGLGPKFFGIQTKGGNALEIDDFKVFSDITGTKEVFRADFNSDTYLEGSAITVDYQYGAKTTANSAASAVEVK